MTSDVWVGARTASETGPTRRGEGLEHGQVVEEVLCLRSTVCVSEGGGCVDLELQGSSTEDSSLEVISMLAGGSSAYAICWPATRANSFRSLVLPVSPARRLESSLHSGPRGHKLALRSIPGMEPNLVNRAESHSQGFPFTPLLCILPA